MCSIIRRISIITYLLIDRLIEKKILLKIQLNIGKHKRFLGKQFTTFHCISLLLNTLHLFDFVLFPRNINHKKSFLPFSNGLWKLDFVDDEHTFELQKQITDDRSFVLYPRRLCLFLFSICIYRNPNIYSWACFFSIRFHWNVHFMLVHRCENVNLQMIK